MPIYFEYTGALQVSNTFITKFSLAGTRPLSFPLLSVYPFVVPKFTLVMVTNLLISANPVVESHFNVASSCTRAPCSPAFQNHLANFTNDQLSAQLGLNFEGVQGGTITSFAQHEVTTGVSSFPYMEGSYIKNPDASKITVIGSLQLSSGENYCVMGIVKHPNANIFFIGDVNGLEQTSQPFTSNLTNWLFR